MGCSCTSYLDIFWSGLESGVYEEITKSAPRIKVEIHSVVIQSYILAGNLDSSETD